MQVCKKPGLPTLGLYYMILCEESWHVGAITYSIIFLLKKPKPKNVKQFIRG